MHWELTAHYSDGTVRHETFDQDEIGTLDDILTHFFITDLTGIDAIKITRMKG